MAAIDRPIVRDFKALAKDPFLAAHAIGDYCFEVGGEFSPASIRDQMIRAYLVVDRAFQENIIDANRDLLVVGAGPSGLTAAIRAAELQVKAVVVEKRVRHAFLLARCRSRDVEPTFYDWPLAHWTKDLFGWTGAHMELSWRADRADIVALDWQRRLPAILRKHPLIDLRLGTSPSPLPGGAHPTVDPLTDMLDVPLVDGGGNLTTPKFGGLVSCVGFGGEDTQKGGYVGHKFWDTDDLQKPNCGLGHSPTILVSGGGDGALQDFVRVMTQRSTKTVFEKVRRALAPTPWLIAAMNSDLQSAEDVAARALSWNRRQHDAPVLRRLEQAHEDVINRLQASSSAWPAIDQAVSSMIPTPAPSVHLVHREPVFSPCYALNRFLTLLILRVVGASIRSPKTEVIDVRPTVPMQHQCLSAATCHGVDHDVDLRSHGMQWTTTYDVIILRHGIAGPRHLFSGASPLRPRHLLPFFVDA